jgi:hypothetical protein
MNWVTFRNRQICLLESQKPNLFMSWLSAWAFLKNRLVSRSFVLLFVAATNMYLFDVFTDAFAKNTLSIELQERVASVFGQGLVVSIYLAAVLEALGMSVLIGYIVSWLRRKAQTSNVKF